MHVTVCLYTSGYFSDSVETFTFVIHSDKPIEFRKDDHLLKLSVKVFTHLCPPNTTLKCEFAICNIQSDVTPWLPDSTYTSEFIEVVKVLLPWESDEQLN